MKQVLRGWVWLALCLTASQSLAANRDAAIGDRVDVDQWQLGVALGLGIKSNPLRGGDDIPLIVLPDISYYGERWFVDNFTLGYSFYQSERLVLSLVTGANAEKAYFSFWHPANLVTVNSSEFGASITKNQGISSDAGPQSQLPPVGIDDVSKRRFAWDGGVLGNLFTPWGEVVVQVMGDVSNVYQGLHGKVEWSRGYRHEDWSWRPSLGAAWQGRELIDYYYGVPNSGYFAGDGYRGRSGWSPYAAMTVSHPINDSWQGLMSVKYQALSPGMADSPLVTTNSTHSIFLGAAYQF